MKLPDTITTDPIPDGNLYSFDEVTPLLEGFVVTALRKYPKYADDINQAALLGAWEVTKDGPAAIEEISVRVKKRVAETLGEILPRKQAEAADLTLRGQETPVSDTTYVANKRAKEFETLPDKEKELLRRIFRDGYDTNTAADELRVDRGQALRLFRRYKKILRDGRPHDSRIDWRREYYNEE